MRIKGDSFELQSGDSGVNGFVSKVDPTSGRRSKKDIEVDKGLVPSVHLFYTFLLLL